jgi:signal transduction histidine kinase
MSGRSLRLKLIALVVGLVVGSSLLASALHGWLAFRALKGDVRNRAAYVASEIAVGISTAQELADRDLLGLQIRNILAARPTLRWLEVSAVGKEGLRLVASSRVASTGPTDLALQSLRQALPLTALGTGEESNAWLAAAPVQIEGRTAGVVALSLSAEGAQRLADGLRQQLLFVLVAVGITMVVSLALYTERSISRPIGALLDTMAAVEGGDLTATPRLARDDEMGRLADGLAHMLARIRTSRDENARLLERISGFNQELRLRVAEATRELAERNEALHRANELLFDLQRALGRAQRLATMGQLTVTVAHEIGTPLNSVAVHLQLLTRSPGLTDQDRQRIVTIEGQIQRLVETVQRLLAATRSAAGRLEPTDLNALVRGVGDLVAPVLAAKGIAYTLAGEEGLPCVRADGHQIQQVLLNLLTNAVDAMPAGGALRVGTARAGGEALLTIADTGVGVPSEARQRIFEPFFTTKTEGGGTGLGLSICRQIVEAHQGSIRIVDTPGGGATFEIRLPLDRSGGNA